jgi:hypothetical protein
VTTTQHRTEFGTANYKGMATLSSSIRLQSCHWKSLATTKDSPWCSSGTMGNQVQLALLRMTALCYSCFGCVQVTEPQPYNHTTVNPIHDTEAKQARSAQEAWLYVQPGGRQRN